MLLVVDDSFLLTDILECGQAFRYERLGEEEYFVIAGGKRLHVKQVGYEVFMSCTDEEFDDFWEEYFDVRTDYTTIQKDLAKIEPKIKDLISAKRGIRILRQDPFEMLITFIISQNKSMVHIKQLVKGICEKYGEKREDEFGFYYSFPTPEALKAVSMDEFRMMKVGFRDKYLFDAVGKVTSGSIDLNALKDMSTEVAREQLTSIKGIGNKVADCILLFGYHKLDVFPVDVWTRRGLTKLYFENEKVTDDALREKAYDVFGQLCGIAQQYIFFGTISKT